MIQRSYIYVFTYLRILLMHNRNPLAILLSVARLPVVYSRELASDITSPASANQPIFCSAAYVTLSSKRTANIARARVMRDYDVTRGSRHGNGDSRSR